MSACGSHRQTPAIRQGQQRTPVKAGPGREQGRAGQVTRSRDDGGQMVRKKLKKN